MLVHLDGKLPYNYDNPVNMKSPLNHIRKWYSRLPAVIKKQFTALIATSHYDRSICEAGSDQETIKSMLHYLEDRNEPCSQVIAKCLFMTKLIALGIYEINRSNYWGKIISNIESHNWDPEANRGLQQELTAISCQSRHEWALWQKHVKTWHIISSRYLTDEHILNYKASCLMKHLKSKYDQKRPIHLPNGRTMPFLSDRAPNANNLPSETGDRPETRKKHGNAAVLAPWLN